MAAEDLLYKSIVTLFSGFIVFLSILINKLHRFLLLLDSYFVIFFFLGIVICIVGLCMMVVWNFKNVKPFEEHIIEKTEKTHFAPYLTIGIILIVIAFTLVFYFRALSRQLYMISLAISLVGIALLLNGLRYFLKEVIDANKATLKNPLHSGI